MTHGFYQLSPQRQRQFQLKLATLFIFLNIVIGALLVLAGLPLLIPFSFALLLTVFAPFVDIPSGIKAGSLIYYSPMLIGEKLRKGRIVLHSGSLFDYYFVLDRTQSANENKKYVFTAYIDGLLKLIERYQGQQPTDISIKATSYILNVRTANKIGLKRVRTDMIQSFILYYNFVNLTCAMSLLNKKLTWPKMQKIFTFEGKLDTLIEKKDELLALQKRFN